jgi:DeoR/GlpR family transcriptional regulator of sugar metabolism
MCPNLSESEEVRSPWVEERRRRIIELLQQKGTVRVSSLCKEFSVSEATIRSDFNELEQKGYIKRVHGGAVLVKGLLKNSGSSSFSMRMKQFLLEKEKIADFAVRNFIENGEVLAVDASTTTTIFIREIARQKKEVTVITNAVNFIEELINYDGVNLILSGGEFYRPNFSLIGEMACGFLSHIRVDKSFIGATAILFDKGFMTVHTGEAEVKKRMIQAANEVFILATHNKIGRAVNLVPFAKVMMDDGKIKLYPYGLTTETKNFKIITDNNFKNDSEREIFDIEREKFSSFNEIFQMVHIKR